MICWRCAVPRSLARSSATSGCRPRPASGPTAPALCWSPPTSPASRWPCPIHWARSCSPPVRDRGRALPWAPGRAWSLVRPSGQRSWPCSVTGVSLVPAVLGTFAEQRGVYRLDLIDRLLEQLRRRVARNGRAATLREALVLVVPMEPGVRGPHVHPDPAGTILAAGAEPGPVEQLAAKSSAGVLFVTADSYPPDVDRRLEPILFRPDPMMVGTGGQRGHRAGAIPGDPGPACVDSPVDALIPAVLVWPWLGPLVGASRPQPPRCFGQEAADCPGVGSAGPPENEK